ncbi:flagellar motor switch protein FliM [Clostridium sp. C105KSO13]|uniref:flagellar motor switch protein FliM n=1 Tax=Clostridium sp. C105KSO13 TaxID=1776045 RepID=UPI000740833F|nr:FliM/FliN family flagellar motor switch protein [Clostridium sp. C105KSO13]CUX49317.1 Flagellar motor switch protein FliM [Clostridium sp. C105KSO13]
MAEVLSQNQIDALLNSMLKDHTESVSESQKEPEKPWKKYDFSSPKKFTKDKLKLIKGIYDNYTRLASSRVNGILRANCEMEVITVEEQHYHEFNNALSDNDVMTLMPLKLPDDSKAPPVLVHISQKLMLNMIDRMLGGSGDDDSVDSSYSYTEIESALYEKMMEYLLGVTKDAWNNYIQVKMGDLTLETNPGLYQEINMEEPVAIILINVKMNEIEGNMTICIPGNLLTNIFSIIDKRKHVSGLYDEGIEDAPEIILDNLKNGSLEIKAELSQAELSLHDVCSLRVGDVIDLNQGKDMDITLYVQEQPWFKGTLGAHKKNAAVRIEERLSY